MRAVGNTIIGEVIPPIEKVGSIFLPQNRRTHTLTQGDCLEVRVTHIGPEVYDVRVGTIVMVDPNAVEAEDRFFMHEGVKYAGFPETYYDWKEASGFLFGVYREDD